jgi:hypothetical protein
MDFVPLKEVKKLAVRSLRSVAKTGNTFLIHMTAQVHVIRWQANESTANEKKASITNYGPKPQQRFGKGAFWFILTSHKGTATTDYYAHSVVVSYFHDSPFLWNLGSHCIETQELSRPPLSKTMQSCFPFSLRKGDTIAWSALSPRYW